MTKNKQTQEGYLKGWQALLVADALFLISLLVSTSSLMDGLANITGFIALLIAIIVGIANLAKRKSPTPTLDTVMTIIGILLFCIIMASLGAS